MIDTPSSRSRSLSVTGVTRSFAGVHALTDVSLAVGPGEVLGLIGPNGAGKSTLVNIISGYDLPDAGTVHLDGQDITRAKPHMRARHGLARTFQHGHLFSGLTVRENIVVTAIGTGQHRRAAGDTADALLDSFGLQALATHAASSLPHGVERRVGVARALAGSPSYVLLDEPAAGLNEGEIGDFADNIRALRDRGLGVLLIDHNVRLILDVCDRIHVLVEGKTLLEGTPDEVRGSEELVEAYLGRSGSVHR
jgi:branched-chain amino acid transport system ATP-binding protein